MRYYSFFILIIFFVAHSQNKFQRCDINYDNGKYYNCSNGIIVDKNLKVGRLEGDKCDRCNPGLKYAIDYTDKKKKLEICVPTEFQEDVEICGNLTIKGDIIGLNITHCAVHKVINTTDITCFQDNCTMEQWCITPHCAMEKIEGTICSRDNCTGVVLCNCSGCVEQNIYFVENKNCGGNNCSVSCDEGDVPFGITCNGTDGLDKVFSVGNIAHCSDILEVSSVGTFCWKDGKYLDDFFENRFLYKIDTFCDDQGNPSCISSCNGTDIAIGTECIMTNGVIKQNFVDGGDAECFINPSGAFMINTSAICISSEYVVKCNENITSPSLISNICNENTCTVSCNSDEYITNGGCQSFDDVIKEMDITNGVLRCTSVDVQSSSIVVSAHCWPNNGTFAQEITSCKS